MQAERIVSLFPQAVFAVRQKTSEGGGLLSEEKALWGG